MSIGNTPTIDQFPPAVLSVLVDGRVVPFRELCTKVADHLGLSTEVHAEQVPSGQARYINRINWACSGLTQAQLLERPQRGHYATTANGREVESRKLKTYPEKDMLEWPSWRTYQEEVNARKKDDPTVSSIAPVNEELQSPIEVMANNEQAFNYKVETELRNRLQQASPEFFEKL